MKNIAVPVNKDGNIDEHFGHCEYYSIYSVAEDGTVTISETFEAPQGCGCKSNIASVLAAKDVTMMLAGSIGNGAVNVLAMQNIGVVRGCQGKADDVVKLFVEGQLVDSGVNCSAHGHNHGEGHNCSH